MGFSYAPAVRVRSGTERAALVRRTYGLVFLGVLKLYDWEVEQAAWLCIGVTFLLRMLAILFNWRTAAVSEGIPLRLGNEDDRR